MIGLLAVIDPGVGTGYADMGGWQFRVLLFNMVGTRHPETNLPFLPRRYVGDSLPLCTLEHTNRVIKDHEALLTKYKVVPPFDGF